MIAGDAADGIYRIIPFNGGNSRPPKLVDVGSSRVSVELVNDMICRLPPADRNRRGQQESDPGQAPPLSYFLPFHVTHHRSKGRPGILTQDTQAMPHSGIVACKRFQPLF
jgi:hypothetical protein